MTNWAIDNVLSVNNNLTLFADLVCRIQVFINETLVWKRNRSEDKSILHFKSVVAGQQTNPTSHAHTHTHTHARARARVKRTEYGREVMLCTLQTKKLPSYVE
jgi:hypothetical protein